MSHGDGSEGSDGEGAGRAAARLAASRAKLLDLTLRNRLLSFPSGAPGYRDRDARVYKHLALSADVDAVWRRLTGDSAVTIRTVDADEDGPESIDEITDRGDLAATADDEHLEKRLLKLYREQETLQSSTGDSAFFLALGFLEWREAAPKGGKSLFAPLLLLHVALARQAKAGGGSRRFVLAMDADAHQGNPALREKLRADHGFDLPPCDDVQSPEAYFASVEATLWDKPAWRVHRTAALGFFNFAGHRLWLDLDPAQWPAGASPAEHAIVRDLVEQRWRTDAGDDEPLPTEDDTARRQVEDDLPVVLEADGTQYAALMAAARGRSLVVIGPPGSGKSQTITNLIAVSLAAGRRVLFVAQKVAALDVVQRLLAEVGLAALCLPLHSDHGRPRNLHDRLRLARGSPRSGPVARGDPGVAAAAGLLNAVATRLGTPLNGSATAAVIGRAVALRAEATAAGPPWRDALLEFEMPPASADIGWADACERALEAWHRWQAESGDDWAGWRPARLNALDVPRIEAALRDLAEAAATATEQLAALPAGGTDGSAEAVAKMLDRAAALPLPPAHTPGLLRQAWANAADPRPLIELERMLADFHRQRSLASKPIRIDDEEDGSAVAASVRAAADRLAERLPHDLPLDRAAHELRAFESTLDRAHDLLAASAGHAAIAAFSGSGTATLTFGVIAALAALPAAAGEALPTGAPVAWTRQVLADPAGTSAGKELIADIERARELDALIAERANPTGPSEPHARPDAAASLARLVAAGFGGSALGELAPLADLAETHAEATDRLIALVDKPSPSAFDAIAPARTVAAWTAFARTTFHRDTLAPPERIVAPVVIEGADAAAAAAIRSDLARLTIARAEERAIERILPRVGADVVDLAADGDANKTVEDLHKSAASARAAAQTIENALASFAQLAKAAALPAPATADDLDRLASLAKRIHAMPPMPTSGLLDAVASAADVERVATIAAACRANLEARRGLEARVAFNDLPSAAELASLRRRLRSHAGTWTRWLRGDYRAARRELATFALPPRPGDAEAVRLLDGLEGLAARKAAIDADDASRALLGRAYAGEATDWAGVDAVLTWARDFYAAAGGATVAIKSLAALRDPAGTKLDRFFSLAEAARRAAKTADQGDSAGDLAARRRELAAAAEHAGSLAARLDALGASPGTKLGDVREAAAARSRASATLVGLVSLATRTGATSLADVDVDRVAASLDWADANRAAGVPEPWLSAIAVDRTAAEALIECRDAAARWRVTTDRLGPAVGPAEDSRQPMAEHAALARRIAADARALADWARAAGANDAPVKTIAALIENLNERDAVQVRSTPWTSSLGGRPLAADVGVLRATLAWIDGMLTAGVPRTLVDWLVEDAPSRVAWWRGVLRDARETTQAVGDLVRAGLVIAAEVEPDVTLDAWRVAATRQYAELAGAIVALGRHAADRQASLAQFAAGATALAYAAKLADELAVHDTTIGARTARLSSGQVAAHRRWAEAARAGPAAIADWLVEDDTSARFERLTEASAAMRTLRAARDRLREAMARLGDVDGHGPGRVCELDVALPAVRVRASDLLDAIPRLLPCAERVRAEAHARQLGLSSLLDAGPWPTAGSVTLAFRASMAHQLARSAWGADDALQRMDGPSHAALRSRFADADASQVVRNRLRVRDLALEAATTRLAEPALRPMRQRLDHEGGKKRAHWPVRKLVAHAGHAVQASCPCWLMTPTSVAQFLPPGSVEFDLVVMDEASQLAPEDAWGAIARGRQLIVVGDPKQMPPSDFFSSSGEGDDDDARDADEVPDGASLDSVLDAARNCLGQADLRWHYRSRHQSLIAPANRFSYDDRLILFPSAHDTHAEMGVRHTFVAGATTTTGSVVNAKEASAIVERLIEIARVEEPKPAADRRTIGVVAMNKAQMDCIQELIDGRRASDASVDRVIAALEENAAEPLFVKNLENIQGDQRDVILISYTYGPNVAGGTPAQRFGPLNADGGERRFNVLITRSKWRMEVFASIRSAQIVAEGKKAGVVHFRDFLAYAEGAPLADRGAATGRSPDSPFEEHVARVLRAAGYEVEPQVGVAGYFMDLAVRDPADRSRFLVGVECDGATYHSSRSARDRDRLREMVLRDRGWSLYRIWSTDWFVNHEAAKRDLLLHIESLIVPHDEQSAVEPGGAG